VLSSQVVSPATGPDEDVPKTLERQTQELLDAITSGSSAVWERLLDPRVSSRCIGAQVADATK